MASLSVISTSFCFLAPCYCLWRSKSRIDTPPRSAGLPSLFIPLFFIYRSIYHTYTTILQIVNFLHSLLLLSFCSSKLKYIYLTSIDNEAYLSGRRAQLLSPRHPLNFPDPPLQLPSEPLNPPNLPTILHIPFLCYQFLPQLATIPMMRYTPPNNTFVTEAEYVAPVFVATRSAGGFQAEQAEESAEDQAGEVEDQRGVQPCSPRVYIVKTPRRKGIVSER